MLNIINMRILTIVRNFFKKNERNKLGRWGIDYRNDHIKAQYANFDNCGDTICKEPKIIKQFIENEKKY